MDETNASTTLVSSSRFGLVRRSEALVLRGVHDLQSKIEAPAEYKLGIVFEFGSLRKPGAAAAHYRRAAELGHIAAQCVLSDLYENGTGVERDHAEATRWFMRVRDAMTSGPRKSLQEVVSGYANRLADFCHTGHAVSKGERHWLMELGNVNDERGRGDVFYHLGAEFSGGLGEHIRPFQELLEVDPKEYDGSTFRILPRQDLTKSYVWFQLSAEAFERASEKAVASGEEDRSLGVALASSRWMCRLVMAQLTLSQIADAEQLATEWVIGPQLGKRVLVVDDEAPICEILCSMLRAAGFECRFATSGMEALGLLDSGERPDVVTTCLMMPGMDGLTFAERLRCTYSKIPVAFASAVHDLSIAEAALRTGACDYLLKPFDRSQLLATVYRALRTTHKRMANG